MSTSLCDLDGQLALITGGTRGIGLATALALARCGARCVVTYRWGSVPTETVLACFESEGLLRPLVVEANAASPEDTAALMRRIADEAGPLDIFVSNAANAVVVRDFGDYDRRALQRTFDASTWPTFDVLRSHCGQFGRYPRRVVVMSSDGADHFAVGYDFVAASKAALEALCRYAAQRLRSEGVHLNVVRSRGVRTEAIAEVFGASLYDFAAPHIGEYDILEPDDVAGAVLMLCSGLLDGMSGQILTVDRGSAFRDNIMTRFERAMRAAGEAL